MEPNRFGRKLGIGVRVASRMVKERAQQSPAAPAPAPAAASTSTPQAAAASAPSSRTAPPPRNPPRSVKNYVEPARRVGEGTRRFGRAFFGPLASVSRTLALEIFGLFFALFTLFFAQYAYRSRASALHGPQHAQFVLFSLVTLAFLYFCVSSFVKATRVGKRRPQ